MSFVMLLGAGALVGLVALTAVMLAALLTEKPETGAPSTDDRSVL